MKLDSLSAPVRTAFEPALRSLSSGSAVVFDADGTLWRGDISEDFLRFIAAHDHLGSEKRSAYAEYDRLNAIDPPASYAYALEVMCGLSFEHVLTLATQFYRERFSGRLFSYVRPLLALLKELGVEIWVCSASPRVVVLPGALALGIRDDHVIGVDCAIEDGRLALPLALPIPCGQGKVTWLERKNVRAALAIGNGDLDVNMLASAEHAVAIAPMDVSDSLILREARARKWPILRL